MLRACVRNMMFFATLPYYLAGEMPRNSAPERPRQPPAAGTSK
jgi:hypothetical protein